MNDHDSPLMPGYRLNAASMSRDLYRLMTAFLASALVHEHVTTEDDPLLELQELHAENEIVHLLVSTAVMNRLQLEHMHRLRTSPDELSYQLVDGECGIFYRDSRESAEKPLMFREACNKIIHAERILVVEIRRPVLQMFGTLRRTEWMIIINILKYIRLSVKNFDDALS